MSPLCPYSADYEDLTSEASVRETIFTDLLADSVAVDDEEAAEEAPVDGGDVPLVCSEANANAIWKPAYKLLFCEDRRLVQVNRKLEKINISVRSSFTP